jgi:hypothetical protein
LLILDVIFLCAPQYAPSSVFLSLTLVIKPNKRKMPMSKNVQNITISPSEVENFKMLHRSLFEAMQASYVRYGAATVLLEKITGESHNTEAADELLEALRIFEAKAVEKKAA